MLTKPQRERFFSIVCFIIISLLEPLDPRKSSVSIKFSRNAWSFGAVLSISSSLVFMAYWTYFESTTGQSIGKKLLHLKTTDLRDRNIDVKTALIESFGKAFLLPVDIILGWIFTNNKRQRILNRASGAIVVKVKEEGENDTSMNVTFLKD
ncbi:MAG: RDD family protein [Candidatus Nitrosopolaris sp.]